jgi:hypothetical protein
MNDFLSQKMSRKQFVTYLGLVMLSISGIGGILKRAANIPLLRSHSKVKVSKGFGNGLYGGAKA